MLESIFLMYLEMAPYLLLGLIFVALMNMYISKEFIIKHTGKRDFKSIFKASLFGIPLPLCSCGVIPTAVYMAKNKSSKPAVTSFLISTPQTGVDSMIATYGMMGPVFAVYRPLAAFAMGLIGGLAVSIFSEEEKKPTYISLDTKSYQPVLSFKEKLKNSYTYASKDFLDDISAQFVFGVIVSGLITLFIPDSFFAEYGVGDGIIGMLILIVIGVPMYICATASIPIALSLMMKGFSPGAAFVFLAVGPVTNSASIAILLNSLGKKITTIFVLSVSILSLIFGYLLNFLFEINNWNVHTMMSHSSHNHSPLDNLNAIQILSTLLFSYYLAFSLYRIYLPKIKALMKTNQYRPIDNNTFLIEGMTCNHCVASVNKAISKVNGVNLIEIDLATGKAIVQGNYDRQSIINEIKESGYTVL